MPYYEDEEDKILHYGSARLSDKRTDELIGICEGIIADDVVCQKEADFLLKFIKNSRAYRTEWPYDVLYDKLSAVLDDGILDNEEAKELFNLLKSLTGGKEYKEKIHHNSTTLPLNNPAPEEIYFQDSHFCLTGKFVLGTRADVEKKIKTRKGLIDKDVIYKTDYLVIGGLGNPAWIHSTYGRKIERAVTLRKQEEKLSIISEEFLARFL